MVRPSGRLILTDVEVVDILARWGRGDFNEGSGRSQCFRLLFKNLARDRFILSDVDYDSFILILMHVVRMGRRQREREIRFLQWETDGLESIISVDGTSAAIQCPDGGGGVDFYRNLVAEVLHIYFLGRPGHKGLFVKNEATGVFKPAVRELDLTVFMDPSKADICDRCEDSHPHFACPKLDDEVRQRFGVYKHMNQV